MAVGVAAIRYVATVHWWEVSAHLATDALAGPVQAGHIDAQRAGLLRRR